MNATMPIGAELNFVQTLREDNRNRERQMQLTPLTAGFFRVRSTNRCIEDARQMKTPQKLFLSLVFEKELTNYALIPVSGNRFLRYRSPRRSPGAGIRSYTLIWNCPTSNSREGIRRITQITINSVTTLSGLISILIIIRSRTVILMMTTLSKASKKPYKKRVPTW